MKKIKTKLQLIWTRKAIHWTEPITRFFSQLRSLCTRQNGGREMRMTTTVKIRKNKAREIDTIYSNQQI